MPKNIKTFKIFVASPSDVSAERDLLESVILELNGIWGSTLGMAFDLVRWERNVRPSFSTDPQAVINAQIGDDYDVFIGIFWGRLGTPTPRAKSGSVEEFDRAYAKMRSGGTPLEIMVYFKDAGISPFELNTEQVQGVNDFRRSLGEIGGVYSVFKDQAGFESSLRAHLSSLAIKFSAPEKNAPLQNIKSPPTETELSVEDGEADYGYFDYIDLFKVRQNEVNSSISAIGDAVKELNDQLSLRADELEMVDKKSIHDMRRGTKRAADDMEGFVSAIVDPVAVLSSSRVKSMDALSKAMAFQRGANSDVNKVASLKQDLLLMVFSMNRVLAVTQGMRNTISKFPQLMKELNVAKRNVLLQLDRIIVELEASIVTLGSIISSIDGVGGKGAVQ